MAWFWDHYAPDAAARIHPDASARRAPDLSGLPPAVVLTAEHDVLRDEGELYATRLLKAGDPVQHRRFDGQMHGFFTMTGVLPGSADGLDFVASAMDRQLTASLRPNGGFMSRRDLIDPDSRGPLDQLMAMMPGGFNSIPGIVERREAEAQLFAGIEVPPNPNVTSQDRAVAGPDGAPEITVRIYRPVTLAGPLPGIYFIHGGGMILGNVESEDAAATSICDQVGAVVVSVEYRLAPEHPHPAQVEDCYAGLTWTARHADELGIDPARLAIYGASAGGGLTIATALLARDRGFPALCFQMPIYPMIDDRNETASSHEITDIGIWDRAGNIEAWKWYLGDGKPDQYAAPARAEDLAGLPPTFIDVGTVDLFRDEDIEFARRLMQAGVPTELHVHPGAYHGSEKIAAEAPLSQRIWAHRIAALRRALA
jgi:acetyl esterase/lipase